MSWFDFLGKSRKDLPFELTKVFSDNEEAELAASVNQSFDHVERVLGFSSVLQHGSEGADELWAYLQAALDDTSYYACLALPLIRQLLEPSVAFVYTGVDLERLEVPLASQTASIPAGVAALPSPQHEIAKDAWMLAKQMRDLDQKYQSLTSAEELVVWSKYFLGISAYLIVVAARASTLPQPK